MHSSQREATIFEALNRSGFVSYRDLEAMLDASSATIRRDLSRLANEGKVERVHGGAKLIRGSDVSSRPMPTLTGTPFGRSLQQNLSAKQAIGRAAAQLCGPGEGIIIDGGTTTFQMCEHLAGLGLQILTTSLHIVDALLPQVETQILLPSGSIFREQNIILAPSGEASMPSFHASKLFLGAAAVSERGIFQADAVLVASQRRLLSLADEVILLVDSSKLALSSGLIVTSLDRISTMIVDNGAKEEQLALFRDNAKLKVLIAE